MKMSLTLALALAMILEARQDFQASTNIKMKIICACSGIVSFDFLNTKTCKVIFFLCCDFEMNETLIKSFSTLKTSSVGVGVRLTKIELHASEVKG